MVSESPAAPTQKSKRIILFDVDDTLIDFDDSLVGEVPLIRWTGGNAKKWQDFCAAIKKLDAIHGTETEFGLITFKTKEDALVKGVLGNSPYTMAADREGLKNYLNPDLIMYTDGYPKGAYLGQSDHRQLGADLWVVDDKLVEVCEDVTWRGFTAINADVVRPDKRKEVKKLDEVINHMLTLANNNKAITLAELASIKSQKGRNMGWYHRRSSLN